MHTASFLIQIRYLTIYTYFLFISKSTKMEECDAVGPPVKRNFHEF